MPAKARPIVASNGVAVSTRRSGRTIGIAAECMMKSLFCTRERDVRANLKQPSCHSIRHQHQDTKYTKKCLFFVYFVSWCLVPYPPMILHAFQSGSAAFRTRKEKR